MNNLNKDLVQFGTVKTLTFSDTECIIEIHNFSILNTCKIIRVISKAIGETYPYPKSIEPRLNSFYLKASVL